MALYNMLFELSSTSLCRWPLCRFFATFVSWKCLYASDLPPRARCHTIVSMSTVPNTANLSSSFSLEAEEALETPLMPPRISPGTTSSLRCTVNEFFPRLPKPNLRFRPVIIAPTLKLFTFCTF